MTPYPFARFTAVLISTALICSGPVFGGEDWPQFLGPHRNGTCDGAELAASWPAGGPLLVWKMDVGQGFAGPVVSDGKLILFHRVADKETVECLDAITGKRIWLKDYPTSYRDDFGFDEGPRATPAIVDGRAFTFGAQGVLTCWDLADGKQIWQVDCRQQFAAAKGFFGMACSPLVEGDAVIVNVGGRDAGIVGFDKNSGKVLWKATHDEASYSSPVAATFGQKRYGLVFDRAGLVALDPATGRVYFQYPFRSRLRESVNAASPLVIGDRIFVSATYGTGAALLEFAEAGPKTIWAKDDVLSSHYATCVYREGFLYGFDGRQESGPSLRCIELATAKVRWSVDNFGAGTLMLAGDRLLVLTEKGELILAPASPDGFKPISHAQILPFTCRAYPALADGLYYARSRDKLVSIDLRKNGPR